jgi:hypothetical protein
MRRIMLAGLILLAACGGGARHTIIGSLELNGGSSGINWDPDGTCVGDGGYSDIGPGAQVTVTDQKGELIATGTLSMGERGMTNDTWVCRFAFTVPDVPGADFYTIEVSHRGGLTYSTAEMDAQGWTVGFTLGS